MRFVVPTLLLAGLGLGGWSCPVTPPKPTPTPTPTATPTPEPTPTPTPTPPPVASSCPKPLAAGAVVYMANKRYGAGLDSTVRVSGDPAFCQMIHGVSVNDCHLEGWRARAACEMELLAAPGMLLGCPIWQYSMDGANARGACRQASHPEASCDHFGDPVDRDDPQTPAFEGRPLACGLQRDPAGDPTAGFFVIGHGEAWFRACKPDGTGCGPWTPGKDKQ